MWTYAGSEFDYATIKSMIERQKSRYGWEFIFLGANIDAVEVAGRFGLERNRAQSFHNDSKGIALNYEVFSDVLSLLCMRDAGEDGAVLEDDWGARIQADYEQRGGLDG